MGDGYLTRETDWQGKAVVQYDDDGAPVSADHDTPLPVEEINSARLDAILKQLKIINIHLGEMTGTHLDASEVE